MQYARNLRANMCVIYAVHTRAHHLTCVQMSNFPQFSWKWWCAPTGCWCGCRITNPLLPNNQGGETQETPTRPHSEPRKRKHVLRSLCWVRISFTINMDARAYMICEHAQSICRILCTLRVCRVLEWSNYDILTRTTDYISCGLQGVLK